MIVTNQGHGAMGISNSIGSNTFDVLLCLGIPWLIKSLAFPVVADQLWVNVTFYVKFLLKHDDINRFRSSSTLVGSPTPQYHYFQHWLASISPSLVINSTWIRELA